MYQLIPRSLPLAFSLALMAASAHPVSAMVFTDRAAFIAALGSLGLTAGTEDYESRPLGTIGNGQILGGFDYAFDPAVTQPAVAPDGNGGRALGGAPNDVFVGGDAVDLRFRGAQPLLAFGADYIYAPSFLPAPATIYRMSLLDGTDAGAIAANGPDLNPSGGMFFVGFIEDLPAAFRDISLYSVVPSDADGNPFFLDAAYQVDNLIFAGAPATAAPEPGTTFLMALGIGVFGLFRRRKSAAASQPRTT